MDAIERAGWAGFAIGATLAATSLLTYLTLAGPPPAPACLEDEVATYAASDFEPGARSTTCAPLDDLTVPGPVVVDPATCTAIESGEYQTCTAVG